MLFVIRALIYLEYTVQMELELFTHKFYFIMEDKGYECLWLCTGIQH